MPDRLSDELLAAWKLASDSCVQAKESALRADGALLFLKHFIEQQYTLSPIDEVDLTTGVITRHTPRPDDSPHPPTGISLNP
jgi:hypothetical protein